MGEASPSFGGEDEASDKALTSIEGGGDRLDLLITRQS